MVTGGSRSHSLMEDIIYIYKFREWNEGLERMKNARPGSLVGSGRRWWKSGSVVFMFITSRFFISWCRRPRTRHEGMRRWGGQHQRWKSQTIGEPSVPIRNSTTKTSGLSILSYAQTWSLIQNLHIHKTQKAKRKRERDHISILFDWIPLALLNRICLALISRGHIPPYSWLIWCLSISFFPRNFQAISSRPANPYYAIPWFDLYIGLDSICINHNKRLSSR